MGTELEDSSESTWFFRRKTAPRELGHVGEATEVTTREP